jgi:hypothetical protein
MARLCRILVHTVVVMKHRCRICGLHSRGCGISLRICGLHCGGYGTSLQDLVHTAVASFAESHHCYYIF